MSSGLRIPVRTHLKKHWPFGYAETLLIRFYPLRLVSAPGGLLLEVLGLLRKPVGAIAPPRFLASSIYPTWHAIVARQSAANGSQSRSSMFC